MKTKITFLTVLFFIISNTQGQNSIDLIKKNNQLLFFYNDCEKPEFFINQKNNNSLTFKDNLLNSNIHPKLTSTLKQRLDSIIDYENSYKSEFIYDTDGKNTQQNSYRRDEINNQWINSSKYEHTFNDNGYLSIVSLYLWASENNQWIYYGKNEYTYDAYGNLICRINFEEWDFESNHWGYGYKVEFNYDTNANLTFVIHYTWSTVNNMWVLYYKYENNYDDEGNITLRVNYDWNIDSSQWDVSSKNEYSYDINGNLTQDINYNWNSSATQWVEYKKYEYNYDDYDNMIFSIRYKIDEITGQWLSLFKNEYAYDSNNNNTQEVCFSWNASENLWVNYWKNESVYNTSFAFSDLILPVMNDEEWQNMNNMLTEVKYYDWNNEQWIFIDSETFYYSEHSMTGIEEVSNSIFTVYPNPTSSYIIIQPFSYVNSSIFELYDIKGTKVIFLMFSNKTQVPTNGLQSGIYFYRIISKEKRISGKLIKE